MCNALKEFFKEDLEEAHTKGKSEGRSEGRSEGESRVNELYNKLEHDGRREDIFRAMNDPVFLKKLYKEYNM